MNVAYPYRRGITDVPYSETPWIIGQYSGFADPKSTNRRFKELIRAGQQGLAIALDLPTQLGLDPDHVAAFGEVGRAGVSLASLDDLDRMFEGIELDSVRQISSTANSIGPVTVAMFLALAARRGVDPNSFSIRIQNDVLKEYVARGTQILPVEPAAEFAVDAIEYCAGRLPGWVPMSISGYHIRDAGASRAQELGFTLANSRDYLSRCRRRGVDLADVARSVTWFFSASAQPLHEAAKFRAARELWATTLREDFGVEDPQATKLRIIAYTLGGEMSAFEISNNAVRVTLAALGAVLGGVQILFCSSIDEALGLPSDDSARLSIRTQQVILRESGIADLIDPLGGSETVERLTDQLVREARDIDRAVTEQGGAARAIGSGWMRAQIDEEAWRSEVDSRSAPRVGESDRAVNGDVRIFKHEPDFEVRRLEAFGAWKANRPQLELGRALEGVNSAIHKKVNLVEPLKDAFLAGATVGEVMRQLVEVHGVAPGREVLLERAP